MAEPYCLAMVLCDAVHRDATTGKFTILGTFSTVGAATVPASIHFCVYFALTDGLGKVDIRLRIVDASEGLADRPDDDAVFDQKIGELEFPSPLMVFEATTLIPQATFPRYGLYHCELYANDNLLMSRRLLVVGPHEEDRSDE